MTKVKPFGDPFSMALIKAQARDAAALGAAQLQIDMLTMEVEILRRALTATVAQLQGQQITAH